MLSPLLFTLAGLATVAQGAAIASRAEPKCTEFQIPVYARSTKMIPVDNIPANLSNSDVLTDYLASQGESVVAGVLSSAATAEQSGNFLMGARYCEPAVYNASRAHTIQYLQHAITMSKNYWHGLSYPMGYDGDKYAYDVVASNNGYPTLAIDNLGHGNSSKPDPFAVVQMSLQTEIAYTIISMLRNGTAPGPMKGKKFNKVIYVGHSYGSIQGNALAATYPSAVDAFVLTGYSGQFLEGTVPLAAGIAEPAALVKPAFAGMDPGYLAQSYEPGRVYGLYTVNGVGGFDPAIAQYDFDHEDTVAVGELATLFYGVTPANKFKGSVFVVTGRQDAIVCNNPDGADCLLPTNKVAAAGGFWPAAADYSYIIPDKTGHDANTHYSSPQSFQLITQYLAKRGF